jgi:hypothetical protein
MLEIISVAPSRNSRAVCCRHAHDVAAAIAALVAFLNQWNSTACLQMRAARLAHLLAKSRPWTEAFTAAGGVQLSMQLVFPTTTTCSSSSMVQLHTLKMLLRVAWGSSIAMAAMVHSTQLVDALMGHVADAGGAISVASSAIPSPFKAKAAKTEVTMMSSEAAKLVSTLDIGKEDSLSLIKSTPMT